MYRFHSPAAADVLYLSNVAEPLLTAMGREPAAQGLLAVDDLPAAIGALHAAVAAQEAAYAQQTLEAEAAGDPPPPRPAVWLRQRAWPLIEHLQRSWEEKKEVVWTR